MGIDNIYSRKSGIRTLFHGNSLSGYDAFFFVPVFDRPAGSRYLSGGRVRLLTRRDGLQRSRGLIELRPSQGIDLRFVNLPFHKSPPRKVLSKTNASQAVRSLALRLMELTGR